MIHVVEEKHLNDFKTVCCVRPRDLYARFGKRESDMSFESNLEQSIPMNMSKIDSIEYLERYDESQAELERQKQTVNDSSVNQHSQNDDSSGEA